MVEKGDDLCWMCRDIAEHMAQRYVQGIVPAPFLAERMHQEWQRLKAGEVGHQGEDMPPWRSLERIAQAICSQELYAAWRSANGDVRNCAFENLSRYLPGVLRNSRYADLIQNDVQGSEEIVQQTLIELQKALQHADGGPRKPAAFIKWTQTILFRQAYAYTHAIRSDQAISLDEQKETSGEQFIDARHPDPQETVLQGELHAELKNAILSLKNRNYQYVLLCTFLEGIEERELASLLKVQVQDIYLWRCRALKTLGSKREVREALQPWLSG